MALKAVILLIIFPNYIFSNNAIHKFVTNKKIRSFKIDILNDYTNSSKFWLEYKYVFESIDKKLEAKEELTSINVGIFLDESKKFDCRRKTNSTTYQGYSMDIIGWLGQTNNIK